MAPDSPSWWRGVALDDGDTNSVLPDDVFKSFQLEGVWSIGDVEAPVRAFSCKHCVGEYVFILDFEFNSSGESCCNENVWEFGPFWADAYYSICVNRVEVEMFSNVGCELGVESPGDFVGLRGICDLHEFQELGWLIRF